VVVVVVAVVVVDAVIVVVVIVFDFVVDVRLYKKLDLKRLFDGKEVALVDSF
jgi:hypothetical protein